MYRKVVKYFYPELNSEEVKKFTILGGLLFLLVGAYWLLRLLKNTIFMKLAFLEELGWSPSAVEIYQPRAKQISVIVVFVLVIIYSKLFESFKRHRLFYILCTTYAFLFLCISCCLFVIDIYGAKQLGWIFMSSLGWGTYFIVESFGSLIIALFWSFTNSVTNTEQAKLGFPLVFTIGQIGASISSSLALLAPNVGIGPIFFITSVFTFMAIPLVKYFLKIVPSDQLLGYEAKEVHIREDKKNLFSTFFSGIVLLLTKPYLIGVLIISTIHETIIGMFEYQMLTQGAKLFSDSEVFARFLGTYAVSANILTTIMILVGLRYIFKKLGTRKALFVYPILAATLLITLLLYNNIGEKPALAAQVWIATIAMVLCKSIAYAVNNPSKEIMYIPTTKEAKFKARGWIDTFGSRGSKMASGSINLHFKSDLTYSGYLFGLGIVLVWLYTAFKVGKKNEELVEQEKVIG